MTRTNESTDDMKEFNGKSLSEFNGKNGRPVCIAYQGKVFDVSASTLWKTGFHMNRHMSGTDLTVDIEAAPHGPELLKRFSQIGIFKKEDEFPVFLPKQLETLLEWIPFLRRHPHPMLVHFPIAFMISPTLFYLLFLTNGINSFEITALHCLGGGILFSVPAILSGFFTWWVNYQAKALRPVRIKIFFSVLLLAISVLAFILRVLSGQSLIYFLLLLLLVPVVSVIGWYGASLTFPLGRK